MQPFHGQHLQCVHSPQDVHHRGQGPQLADMFRFINPDENGIDIQFVLRGLHQRGDRLAAKLQCEGS